MERTINVPLRVDGIEIPGGVHWDVDKFHVLRVFSADGAVATFDAGSWHSVGYLNRDPRML